MEYTPISIQELPQKTISAINPDSALVMISEIDTGDVLSSYTVSYFDIIESIKESADKVTDQFAVVYFPSSFVPDGINNPMDSLNQAGQITDLSLFDNARPETLDIELTDVANFNIYLANVPPINNTFTSTKVTITPAVLGNTPNINLFRATKVNITFIQQAGNPISLWESFEIYIGDLRVDLIDSTYSIYNNFFTLELLVNGLSPEDVNGGKVSFQYVNNTNKLLASTANNLQTQINNIGPGGEVTYNNVLAVFAPEEGNIDFGTYVNPGSGLNQITLDFDTTEIEGAIEAAIVSANNYTDQQIALIDFEINPNGLPTITVPNVNITNNPTSTWTTLGSYAGQCSYQILEPTNNYILNYTFDNGKITGNAGNTGIDVPLLTVNNINNYMMCPIVLNNAALTNSYIFVTINITITNRYTGPNTIGNQAFNLYINNSQLNYLNHIQLPPAIPVKFSYSEFSPAPFAVGDSWVITRTFAVNSQSAVNINNPTTISYNYNAQNFAGASTTPPTFYPWSAINAYGIPGSPNTINLFAAYTNSTFWQTSGVCNFYAELLNESYVNIIMNFDWAPVNAGNTPNGNPDNLQYNSCFLFLNKAALTSVYIPVNLKINYRMKVTTQNQNKTWNIYLQVNLLNNSTLPSSVPPDTTNIKIATFVAGSGAPYLGVNEGVFEKTIWVNKDNFSQVNPNNNLFLNDLGDVNSSPLLNSVLSFRELANAYQSVPISTLLNISYNEVDYLNEHPNFTPSTGPYLEEIILQNFNYTYNLSSVYFGLPTGKVFSHNLLIDATNLSNTIKFILIINNSVSDNAFQSYTFTIKNKIFIPPTINPNLEDGQTLIILKDKITIPAYSVGTFVFECTQISINLISTNIDTLPPTDALSYLLQYTNDINKQNLNTGFYANLISIPSALNFPSLFPNNRYRFGENFASDVYDVPSFMCGGDTFIAHTFLPSHPNRAEFWKSKEYCVCFDTNDTIETSIKAFIANPTARNSFYPRMARLRVKLDMPDLNSIWDNTENNWEKEFGTLIRKINADPTKFLEYVDKFEMFGWDGAGNNVYISYVDGVSTYDNSSNALLAMKNTFIFIQNLDASIVSGSSSGSGAPYYMLNVPYGYDYPNFTKQYWQLSSNPITEPNVYPNPYPADPTTRYDLYKTTLNIDRPPVLFQGYFQMTFDDGIALNAITGMNFVSFLQNNANIVFPEYLIVTNYKNGDSNTGEIGLTNVLKILEENTYTPRPYVFPFISYGNNTFTGYNGFIFNGI